MRYYIYKLYFRNGCTYIGKHKEKRENDGYITSSSYYKKHKDLLERREIILEVNDIDTLDIMETICILSDIVNSPYNVNRNKGAWLNHSNFDRGFSGPSNGMWGRIHSEQTRKKISDAFTEDRKKKDAIRMREFSFSRREETIKMNKSPEHIQKVKEGLKRFIDGSCYHLPNTDKYISVQLHRKYHHRTHRLGFIRVKNEGYNLLTEQELVEYIKRTLNRCSKLSGVHWYNNGIEEIQCINCPEGYKKGRLKFSKEAISNMTAARHRKLLDPEYRQKLIDSHQNPYNKGKKTGPNTKLYKPVIDTQTGIRYGSVQETLDKLGISNAIFYKERKNGRFKYGQ